ncbi:MAG: type II 3-dehydroquinate dehydratase [Gemmatimonadota bacterium]|nr:type II 3-dehydroquinate dehydratase [Gemmatimonadota bacterium]
MRIGVLHGPNLNLLGSREPEHYGSTSLRDIDAALAALAVELGVEVETFQSNHEGELVDRVQDRSAAVDGWLVNAAGLTHTSVALRDALVAGERPLVEVHLSNPWAREPFRHTSLLTDVAIGIVSGFRADSYRFALQGLVARLRERS